MVQTDTFETTRKIYNWKKKKKQTLKTGEKLEQLKRITSSL